MTLYDFSFKELEYAREIGIFPFFWTDYARGEAERCRKWGVVGSLRQNRCFADDSPLASPP